MRAPESPFDHQSSPPPSVARAFPGDQVHVWRARLDQPTASREELAQTLSPDEIARAERFLLDLDRNRFVAGRGILRRILSRYLELGPERLRFSYSATGKPTLGGELAGSPIRFNLAHSGDLAVYAVAADREIGVDLERVRDLSDAEQIARRHFAAEEQAALRALPPDRHTEGFFNCWTRKEAYLKATGAGLATPLSSFRVELRPDVPAQLLRVDADPAEGARWKLFSFNPLPDYVAALCVEGPDWRCVHHLYPDASTSTEQPTSIDQPRHAPATPFSVLRLGYNDSAMSELRILRMDRDDENKILRQKSKRVPNVDARLQRLIDDMVETMHAHNGVGLAAPQVGTLLRLTVIQVPDEYEDPEFGKDPHAGKLFVLINPEIVKLEGGEYEPEEGCLSLPGYWANIKRFKKATVKARDRNFKEYRIKAQGLFAQALQHEIDHLNGVLFIDHLDSLDKLYKVEDNPRRRRRRDDDEDAAPETTPPAA